MSLTTPAARRDLSFHLHPATNLRAVQTEGPLVITRGEGVYVFDDEGRRYLNEQQSTMDDIRSRISAGWDAASRPEVADLMHELQMLGRALFRHGTRGALHDPERLKKLRDILAKARAEVDALAEDRPPAPTGAPPSEPRMV